MIRLHTSEKDYRPFRFAKCMITTIVLGLFAGSNVFGDANRESTPE
jgi:hypothetical protein